MEEEGREEKEEEDGARMGALLVSSDLVPWLRSRGFIHVEKFLKLEGLSLESLESPLRARVAGGSQARRLAAQNIVAASQRVFLINVLKIATLSRRVATRRLRERPAAAAALGKDRIRPTAALI
jgi:hypothetical protein